MRSATGRSHASTVERLPIASWWGESASIQFLDLDWSRERSSSHDVDCLLDIPSGLVTLTLHSSGCFHFEDGEVTIAWTPKGATVQSSPGQPSGLSRWISATGGRAQPLTASETRAAVHKIVAATHVFDQIVGFSTEHRSATLRWSCDDQPERVWLPKPAGAGVAFFGSSTMLFMAGADWFYEERP
jgi:hypothetical protein